MQKLLNRLNAHIDWRCKFRNQFEMSDMFLLCFQPFLVLAPSIVDLRVSKAIIVQGSGYNNFFFL